MIFVIVGPTGVGKSSLGLEYVLRNDGYIVNGDAFQCYKEMNIGTAKPSLEERKKADHFLFDIASVEKGYTIYDYQRDLRNTLDTLLKQNKDIIIVGGSGLYLKSALYDFTLNDSNNEIDMTKFNDFSNEELFAYLMKIDPESTINLHMNNRKRVLRAIEIYLESGNKKSEIIAAQKHQPLYDVTFVGLSLDNREQLYELINKRVDMMIKEGLIEEVKTLMKQYDPSLRAFQAIGYKELMEAFINNTSIEEAIELIKKRTRNYAKRQYTYFRNQLSVNWFNSKKEALEFMEQKARNK